MQQEDASLQNQSTFTFGLLGGVMIVIVITVLLVAISFIIFLNSGAYRTVQQISAAEAALKDEVLEGLDTTSPIQATELKDYSAALPLRVKNINDAEDFNPKSIDPSALGGF